MTEVDLNQQDVNANIETESEDGDGGVPLPLSVSGVLSDTLTMGIDANVGGSGNNTNDLSFITDDPLWDSNNMPVFSSDGPTVTELLWNGDGNAYIGHIPVDESANGSLPNAMAHQVLSGTEEGVSETLHNNSEEIGGPLHESHDLPVTPPNNETVGLEDGQHEESAFGTQNDSHAIPLTPPLAVPMLSHATATNTSGPVEAWQGTSTALTPITEPLLQGWDIFDGADDENPPLVGPTHRKCRLQRQLPGYQILTTQCPLTLILSHEIWTWRGSSGLGEACTYLRALTIPR